jgi:peptide deformylase
MIEKIRPWGEPILTQVAREIDDAEVAEQVTDALHDTLTWAQGQYDFTRGSGVAAPQIGRLWRASVVEFNCERHTLINPRIIAHSPDRQLVREGCMSFFRFRGDVLRYADVVIEAEDEQHRTQQVSSEGDLNFSSFLQHELDHLDGILYVHRMQANQTDGMLIRTPDRPLLSAGYKS